MGLTNCDFLLDALDIGLHNIFVLDGKLFSIKVENFGSIEESTIDQNIDVEREIEENPELKASLKRYVDVPEMKKYTANELKEKRIANRK